MESQHDHARMSAPQYRQKDATLVRQEAEDELREWKNLSKKLSQPRERKSRVSTSRTA